MSQDDVIAIERLVNLYALGVDTQRWELFDEVFTADVLCEYNNNARWTNLATFKSDFAAYHAPFDGTQHTMTNFIVDIQGDTARAVTYGHWRLIRKGLPGGDFWEGNGWYEDKVVRTSAGWRIKHRTCGIIWWGGNPQVNETTPDVKFDLPVKSLRDEADAGRVSYLKNRNIS